MVYGTNDWKLSDDINMHKYTHPLWHLVYVCRPMMIVEYNNSQHDRRSHHEHDAVEVGACNTVVTSPYRPVLLQATTKHKHRCFIPRGLTIRY